MNEKGRKILILTFKFFFPLRDVVLCHVTPAPRDTATNMAAHGSAGLMTGAGTQFTRLTLQ